MNLYTYFAPINEHPSPDQAALIATWKESWRKHGWNPVVLGPADAAKHPRYHEAHEIFERFPTVNAKGYEMACWLRWCAMAVVGGTLTDYDVANVGFRPEQLPKNDGQYVSIMEDENPCPCMVSGDAQQYESTLNFFLNYKLHPDDVERGGRPHASDQNCIQREHARFRPFIFNLCRDFQSKNWQNVKLVHFSHGSCGSHNRLAAMRGCEQLQQWARR